MKKLLENDMVNTVQSIKKFYNLKQEHRSNNSLDNVFKEKKPKHVVLMCLDGLGYSLIDNAPFLKSNLLEKIDTVFPPTTACATISLQTGLYPCEHGWIGWSQYFKEYDAVIELFSGQNYYTREQYNYDDIIKDIQFERFFTSIENNKTFLPKFDPNGYETFDLMLEGVSKHIKSNDTSFSYVYWNEPDHILHIEGSESTITKQVIQELNNSVETFSRDLEETLIIITADHGHIDCEGLELNNYPKLTETFLNLPAIEARCVTLTIKEGMDEQFNKEVKPLLEYFDLYTKEEFMNSDFFNHGKRHFKVDVFLGDYMLIAKDKYYLCGSAPNGVEQVVFKSAHAGSTIKEMEIPLIIIK